MIENLPELENLIFEKDPNRVDKTKYTIRNTGMKFQSATLSSLRSKRTTRNYRETTMNSLHTIST